MYQTGLFSSAFVVSQSKFTGKLRAQHLLCHKVNLLSCIVKRPLCYGVNLPSRVARRPLFHKVNLPRCEARRYHFIMTCDIFGTGQTNILSLCYLFGETPRHIETCEIERCSVSESVFKHNHCAPAFTTRMWSWVVL